MPGRKLPRAIVTFIKDNPIVAAVVIMVVIGLGLVFAARSDKNARVISNAEIGSKGGGAEIATPSGPAVIVGPTETATSPDGPQVEMPTTPSLTPGGEGPEAAPVKKPVAAPAARKAASAGRYTARSTLAE